MEFVFCIGRNFCNHLRAKVDPLHSDLAKGMRTVVKFELWHQGHTCRVEAVAMGRRMLLEVHWNSLYGRALRGNI